MPGRLIEGEYHNQYKPPVAPQEPYAHESESPAEESQGLARNQSDFPQVNVDQGALIQSVDQDMLPQTVRPESNPGDGGYTQKYEQALDVRQPPMAHLAMTNSADLLLEDSHCTATQNEPYVEGLSSPAPAYDQQQTMSPELSTTVIPEVPRIEPHPENVTLHPHQKQTLSVKMS